MLPEVNQIISDFKLLKKEYIAEIDSTVLRFEHQKTKAQLVPAFPTSVTRIGNKSAMLCVKIKLLVS